VSNIKSMMGGKKAKRLGKSAYKGKATSNGAAKGDIFDAVKAVRLSVGIIGVAKTVELAEMFGGGA
jgi:hypothetical protein